MAGEMAKIQSLVREAAQAHTDLNTLYGVIALLEGGTISAARAAAVERITRICKSEAQRCLNDYDRLTARIVAATPGVPK
jgi:hypothetical protein